MDPQTSKSQLPAIILIDDDYGGEILVENLNFRGFAASRVNSYVAAMKSIQQIARADLVLLDIIMEGPPSEENPKISGDRSTGMAILQALRERNPNLPIIVFSGTSDADIIDAIGRNPNTTFVSARYSAI